MAQKKDNNGGGKGKDDNNDGGAATVVLKIDMHCEGCANRIIKCAKAFQGVERARVEWEASKLTVEGKVNPGKLRQRLQEKTKKKVELVSPQPKKDKENKENSDDNKKKDDTSNFSGTEKKKADDKKPKEPPVTTAVLKLGLHCQGCVQKIHKLVSKASGVKNVLIDQQKDLLTVTGTMDVNALAATLKGRMKRVVEIVPPKKENGKGKENEEKKEGNGGGNEQKSGNGNNNYGNGGGNKKAGNCGGNKGENGFLMMEGGNRMELYGTVGYPANAGYGYGYLGGYGYGYVYGENVHAPQYFSDENPNACSIM